MANFPLVSVIVCTRDRPTDLARLLLTILCQSSPPIEVIVVDGSPVCSAQRVANLFASEFASIDCRVKYIKDSAGSLPTARTEGVKHSIGDFLLFVDDDTLLDRNVITALTTFLQSNPEALIASPQVLDSKNSPRKDEVVKNILNSFRRLLMLSYLGENRMEVRRSGSCVFPSRITKTIASQRVRGCCFCSKRQTFDGLQFDTNLKRWGYLEDLDFFYRVYRKNPKALYIIPQAKIVHNRSVEARLPMKQTVYQKTIHWFYVFFKDIFGESILNLIAFLWALIGNLVITTGEFIFKRKPKEQWWEVLYLVKSYFYAFRHMSEIKKRDLDFFNKRL